MSTPAKGRVRRVAASLRARLKRLSLRKLLRLVKSAGIWLFLKARDPRALLSSASQNVGRLSRRTKRIGALLVVASLLGTPLALLGLNSITYQSPQVSYYNQAMNIYRQAQPSGDWDYIGFPSIALFQQSIAAYKSESDQSRIDEWLHGAPSNELLALAYFHLGLVELGVGEDDGTAQLLTQAVADLKSAITVDPGLPYASYFSASDVNRLAADSLAAKYDLELLFAQNPQQEQARAKPGSGQPKVGQETGSGQQQAPKNNPQNVPGGGSSNGI